MIKIYIVLQEGLNDCLNELGYALKYAEKYKLEAVIYTAEAKVNFDFEDFFIIRKKYDWIKFEDKPIDIILSEVFEFRNRYNQMAPIKDVIWKESGGGLKSVVALNYLYVNFSILNKISKKKFVMHMRCTDYMSDVEYLNEIIKKSDEKIYLISDNKDILNEYNTINLIECDSKDINGNNYNSNHQSNNFVNRNDKDIKDLFLLSSASISISSPISYNKKAITENFSGYYLLSLVLKYSLGKRNFLKLIKSFYLQLKGLYKYGGRNKMMLIRLNITILIHVIKNEF